MDTIRQLIDDRNTQSVENENPLSVCHGWVRTLRESSSSLGFCNINDGSNIDGMQLIISDENMEESEVKSFLENIKLGAFLSCVGTIVPSPAKGQDYELLVKEFNVSMHVDENYPLCKSKMNIDTLRNHIHFRARTNTFGSVFRIRSSLTKILHDFYHSKGYLHLDPNIITVNECEGGAGVFQITENNITNLSTLNKTKEDTYDWNKDHFCKPAYLTVSSQLQLEAMACSLGNVYTMNKSFRSEHSCTSKHVSEFTHLEIEIVNNTLNDLMDVGEEMVRYCIREIFARNKDELENLNKFVSKGLIDRLETLEKTEFKHMTYAEAILLIQQDILSKKTNISNITYGDDLGSEHENYIVDNFNGPVFITHWPFEIKSFYMKQCDDGTCESFDLLMPHGIGELIGASQREDDYQKLLDGMKTKKVPDNSMQFYIDLRKYGTCPHGGFGMGFDRLLMLMTGMTNIKDVIPFPVFYKSCNY